MSVAENLAHIQERVASAARRVGREPETITLMAVSKTVSSDKIRELYQAGQRLFGESRIQEFAGKTASLQDLRDAAWHMIGHLQSNKASKAAELFGAVDSVDSLRLAEKLNAAAEQVGKKLPLLIEINVGAEAAKSGVWPESSELQAILRAAAGWNHVEVRGLMTVPPFGEDAEAARPFFRRMRELRDEIAQQNLPKVSMGVLSMGMSHDFEIAIEEGSTTVRVGTAIFGNRESQALARPA